MYVKESVHASLFLLIQMSVEMFIHFKKMYSLCLKLSDSTLARYKCIYT
jgi:hypothetical protein